MASPPRGKSQFKQAPVSIGKRRPQPGLLYNNLNLFGFIDRKRRFSYETQKEPGLLEKTETGNVRLENRALPDQEAKGRKTKSRLSAGACLDCPERSI